MKHIMFCTKCREYTLKSEHCGMKTLSTKPPKYSPEDKYAKYRRTVKEEQENERAVEEKKDGNQE